MAQSKKHAEAAKKLHSGPFLSPEERTINRLHERIDELTRLLRKQTAEAAAAVRRAERAEQRHHGLVAVYWQLVKRVCSPEEIAKRAKDIS